MIKFSQIPMPACGTDNCALQEDKQIYLFDHSYFDESEPNITTVKFDSVQKANHFYERVVEFNMMCETWNGNELFEMLLCDMLEPE